jgi:hypothetical protein
MEKKTTKQFVEEAKKIHGNKYDYSKVEYINKRTKVCIICPIHGEFWQRPNDHLKGCGCYECGRKNCTGKKVDTNSFINEAKKIHGNKYDYSKTKYINSKTKVCIICPEHGEFWQIPSAHTSGQGCPKCKTYKIGKNKYNTEIFINLSKKIHGNKYDYSKTKYINSKTKVCIICPEHGEFWQEASRHLMGDNCPKCKNSSLENSIIKLLSSNNIKFINGCNKTVLPWIERQHLDFYLPDYNVAIECQGLQHFKKIDFFGGESNFIELRKRDINKLKKCKEHNIKLLYYTEDNYEEFLGEKLFKNTDDLLKEIRSTR